MKLKDRIKTYNFWVSLSSAIFLIIKLLGHQFGFSVDESLFSDLITSLCSILVILGIIVPPTSKNATVKTAINNPNFNPLIESNLSTETKNDISSTTETNNEINYEATPISSNHESSQNNFEEEQNFNEIEKQKFEATLDELEPETFDINKIKYQVAETLSNQEILFEDNLCEYIELLENEINLIKNR